MKDIIERSLEIYNRESCCHKDRDTPCNCLECWGVEFFEPSVSDTYDCLKKICYYALRYAPVCVSELYHLFSYSKLLEKYAGCGASILSLGCGIGTDIVAIQHYLKDNNLMFPCSYHGVDLSPFWAKVRNSYPNTTFVTNDVFSELDKINLSHFNMIFLNRFLSTLKKADKSDEFFAKILPKIDTEFQSGSYLILNDINVNSLGRDEFFSKLGSVFPKPEYYYFHIKSKTYRGIEFGNFARLPSNSVIPRFSENSPYAPQNVQEIVFAVFQKK